MNRREALRQGALAVSGLAAAGVSGNLFAQTAHAQVQQSEVRFGSRPAEVLTPYSVPGRVAQPQRADIAVLERPGNETLMLAAENGSRTSGFNLADQFIAFQATSVNGTSQILESSSVEPALDTPAEKPDVIMDVSMQAFHVGESEPVEKDTRATLRLTVNKDADSTGGRGLDTLFWTITSGLKLYDDLKKARAESKDLQSDYRSAFANRYIEIPGALGDIRFEVIKHKEPAWWQKVFKFAESDAGRALTAAIGFPAVTQQVVRFVDEVTSRFDDRNAELLFASQPLKFAFSKQARANYVGSSPIKIGSLNQGLWVLARGRDLATLADAKAYFYPTYGRLIPANKTPQDFLSPSYVDPFREVTYAVFRVQMQATKLNFSFNT